MGRSARAMSIGLLVSLGLLVLMAPSCSGSGGKPGDFFALKAAGITYTLPQGWEVVDPPLNDDGICDRAGQMRTVGFNLMFVQKNIAVGAFRPDGQSVVCVACQGPHKPYDGSGPDPLIHRAGKEWEKNWWNENLPLVCERKEGTVALADGTKLAYRQARMKPGVLAGEDVVHGVAAGEVKGRYLAIAAGARAADRTTAPRLEAHIRQVAACLALEGDSAPAAISNPE